MEEVIELKKTKWASVTINNDLEDCDDVILFPEKFKEAQETLAKYPIPAEIYLARFSQTKQEHGFEIYGILKNMNTASNTFLVIEAVSKHHQRSYNIRTEPETLAQLVKVFLDKPIKVHIRPQINADNLFEYELIEVKVD